MFHWWHLWHVTLFVRKPDWSGMLWWTFGINRSNTITLITPLKCATWICTSAKMCEEIWNMPSHPFRWSSDDISFEKQLLSPPQSITLLTYDYDLMTFINFNLKSWLTLCFHEIWWTLPLDWQFQMWCEWQGARKLQLMLAMMPQGYPCMSRWKLCYDLSADGPPELHP